MIPLVMAIIKGITEINSSNSNGSSPAQGLGDLVSKIGSSSSSGSSTTRPGIDYKKDSRFQRS